MSIAVKFSFKVTELHEDDMEALDDAIREQLARAGWGKDIQRVEAKWSLGKLWYASDWDHPMQVSRAVESMTQLEAELRDLVAKHATRKPPVVEVLQEFPDFE
jgi:hypothetical protein